MDDTNQTQQTPSLDSVSPATKDEKKIISRLILQRLLSSEVTKFLDTETHAKVSSAFLSEAPDNDLSISFRSLKNRNSYYSTIATLELKWKKSETEINDLDGNAWVTYTLTMVPNISSMYSSTIDTFRERAECISMVDEIVCAILEMAPKPIRVMELNNEERIARDTKRTYDGFCTMFTAELSGARRALRRGLRRGGNPRVLPTDFIGKAPAGTYEFSINDGSRYNPNVKKYALKVNTGWDGVNRGRLYRVS